MLRQEMPQRQAPIVIHVDLVKHVAAFTAVSDSVIIP